MAQITPHRRPHYPPTDRMAILELRAARGWNQAQAARAMLVTPATVAAWMRRVDEQGPDALLQLPEPVNQFPDFVRHIVRRLKALCPSMGKVKIARQPLNLIPYATDVLDLTRIGVVLLDFVGLAVQPNSAYDTIVTVAACLGPCAPPRSWPASPSAQQPGLFFQEVQFHLQLPDLLVQPGLEPFVVLLGPPMAIGEQLRQPLQGTPLPGRDLRGVHLVQTGQLIDRPLPPDRLQSHPRLQCRAVTLPLTHLSRLPCLRTDSRDHLNAWS